MEHGSIILPHKSTATLRLSTYQPGPSASNSGPLASTLVVFLNGLGLPRASWLAAAGQLIATRTQRNKPTPYLLAYDRYGQGESDPDPTDAPGSPYGHDLRAVVADLHELVAQVSARDLGLRRQQQQQPAQQARLLLVGNSIGTAIARLYAAAYPGTVEAFLLLDPMVANTDFVSIMPDVDAPGFDAGPLQKAGLSLEEVRHARAMAAKMFHPSVPNGERLDRRNAAELLPEADGPLLPPGPSGRPPVQVVVGHDPDTFAEQTEQGPMKTSKAVTNAYTNPHWAAYNAGLAKLADGGVLKIATGCGHFVQKDDPVFVATELDSLLDAVAERGGA